MASIFTRIVNKEIPAYVVAETDDYLAFLDVRPQVKGHTLVIPKKEVDYIFDKRKKDENVNKSIGAIGVSFLTDA